MAFFVPSFSYLRCHLSLPRPWISNRKQVAFGRPVRASAFRRPCLKSSIFGTGMILSKRTNAVIPDTPLLGTTDVLDAFEDEYGGVVVDPTFLPNTSNAFSASLRSSLSYWSQQGKRGVWLKVLEGQADLVPIAIKEGFIYHHAEPGYVMLTFWLPDGPAALPSTSLHQIGVGAFVMNEKQEVLVVKERKCPSHCAVIWKIPTGFIDKWMPLDEFINQPFHQEDEMYKAIVDICIARYQKCYTGFAAHQVTSKLDNRVAYLYFQDTVEAAGCVPETSWYKV